MGNSEQRGMDMKIKIIGLIVILCLTLVMAPIQVFAGDASGSVSVGLDTGIGGIVMAPPMASPSPSTYTSAQSVTLSAPGSTGIYYTLNGFPGSNTSTPYTSPINIAVTTTITCIAYYAETNHTGVSAAYLYTINIPTSILADTGGGGGAPPPSGGGGNTVYGGTTNISGGINSKGVFTTAENCWSDDYQAVLYITAGVTGLTSSGAPLSSIGVVRMTTPPSFPAGSGMMGFAYDFTPAGATFNPGIQVRMPYNPSALPAGVSATSLQMSYYDSTLGAWVTVPTQVDTVNDFVWGTISHFTPYAITYGVKPVTAVLTTTSTTTTSVNNTAYNSYRDNYGNYNSCDYHTSTGNIHDKYNCRSDDNLSFNFIVHCNDNKRIGDFKQYVTDYSYNRRGGRCCRCGNLVVYDTQEEIIQTFYLKVIIK